MRLKNTGFLALTIGSIGILALGYAQSGGTNPFVPDHEIVPRAIRMKDTALFRDASTLWLTSNLENGGMVQLGRAKKFVETTVFYRTAILDQVSEVLVRHKRWESASGMVVVGGNPAEVRNMTSTEHLAAMIMFNRTLVNRNLADMPVVDENGIRGTLHPEDVGLTSAQLAQMIEAKRQQQMQYLAGGSGGTP